MRKAVLARLAAGMAATLLWIAPAAGLDCNGRRLRPAEAAICQDAQLARTEDRIERRIRGLARRLSFGQYLGIRHWQADWAVQRGQCGGERTCLAGSSRAQLRFLDRLQQCLDTSSVRRACLRNAINVEREALRR
jgi:uncharacterized protein